MEVMSMVDMAMDPKEATEVYNPTPADAPRYPYGLCISLCGDELEKLKMDYDDLCVGDLVHFHAMAMITCKSCSETQGGEPNERVELQICRMSAENEDEENEQNESARTAGVLKAIKKLYKDT